MKWNLKDQFKDIVIKPQSIKLEGPPCSSCKFWKPEKSFEIGDYDGKDKLYYIGEYTLCHNTEMKNDFSCYEEKEDIYELVKNEIEQSKPITISLVLPKNKDKIND